jgi:hypothetical protein
VAILATIVAFPIYQAIQTGGPIFYATNVDEASHLAFWYANYIIEDSGRLRESSRLVRQLHLLGVPGGYINLLFDICLSLTIVTCTARIWRRLGCSAQTSRLAALLLFTSPIIFSPFNPFLLWLNELRFETSISTWLSMPYSPELVFLRSPEPQLSWALVALLCSRLSHPLMLGGALLVASPLMYPFVRVPVIFTTLLLISKERFGLFRSAVVLFALLSLLTLVFSTTYVEPTLRQFFVFSRLPVAPLSGILAILILAFIKRSLPSHITILSVALIISIWAVQNLQLISGWLVTPVNYEQYWGTFALGFILTCAAIYKGTNPRVYLYCSLAMFFLHTCAIFSDNLAVFNRLESPQKTLQIAKEAPSKLACTELYLATYLDLAFAHRDPTALSWTRTLSTATTKEYLEYQCVKSSINHDFPAETAQFESIFWRLDLGFAVKGDDFNVSMKRRPIIQQALPAYDLENCPKQSLVLCGKSSKSSSSKSGTQN